MKILPRKGQSFLRVKLNVFKSHSLPVAIHCFLKNRNVTRMFSPEVADILADGGLGLNTDALNRKY